MADTFQERLKGLLAGILPDDTVAPGFFKDLAKQFLGSGPQVRVGQPRILGAREAERFLRRADIEAFQTAFPDIAPEQGAAFEAMIMRGGQRDPEVEAVKREQGPVAGSFAGAGGRFDPVIDEAKRGQINTALDVRERGGTLLQRQREPLPDLTERRLPEAARLQETEVSTEDELFGRPTITDRELLARKKKKEFDEEEREDLVTQLLRR